MRAVRRGLRRAARRIARRDTLTTTRGSTVRRLNSSGCARRNEVGGPAGVAVSVAVWVAGRGGRGRGSGGRREAGGGHEEALHSLAGHLAGLVVSEGVQ